MRSRTFLPALVLVIQSSVCLAGPNAETTLVLHAVQTDFGFCNIADPCAEPQGPLATVQAGQRYAIYFLLRNYHDVACFQFKVEIPDDWMLHFTLFDCQPGMLDCYFPEVSCCMMCVTGGATAVLGRAFLTPGTGCLRITESAYPFGTHVVSCQQEVDPLLEQNRGRICVGPGGINSCLPAPTPVGPGTWGAIKDSYRTR